MDNFDTCLEFGERIIQEIRLTKYVRENFEPETYKGLKFEKDEFLTEDVEEGPMPDELPTLLRMVYGIMPHEEMFLEEIAEVNDVDVDEIVQGYFTDGYDMIDIVRFPFLKELWEEDREMYDKIDNKIKHAFYVGGYNEDIIEAYLGGDTNMDVFNHDELRDVLFIGEFCSTSYYEFFKEFHKSFEEVVDMYKEWKKNQLHTFDERLRLLLNIPEGEDVYGGNNQAV